MYVYGLTYSKSMDQPGKVANPERYQLNRENEYFPVRIRACEFGLARPVRQSCPASACSSPYSGWIWCLLTEFPPNSAVVWDTRDTDAYDGAKNVGKLHSEGLEAFRIHVWQKTHGVDLFFAPPPASIHYRHNIYSIL